MLDRAVENALVRGIFGQNDLSRRWFLNSVGGSALAAVLGSILPLDAIKAAVKDDAGKLEKTKLKVGFVPITCATPYPMSEPPSAASVTKLNCFFEGRSLQTVPEFRSRC